MSWQCEQLEEKIDDVVFISTSRDLGSGHAHARACEGLKAWMACVRTYASRNLTRKPEIPGSPD